MMTLPNTISSSEDLMSLILELRTYAKWLNQYTNAQKARTKYSGEQPELSPTTLSLLRDFKLANGLTVEKLDDLIKQLEQLRTHAKSMTITLAAPATNEVKQSLVTWARTNIAPDLLISFRFNSVLLGGMVVRIGSHIYDWSFRRTILNERHTFGEVLKNV